MSTQALKMFCPKCIGYIFYFYQLTDGPRRVSLIAECTNCKTRMIADSAFEMTMEQSNGDN